MKNNHMADYDQQLTDAIYGFAVSPEFENDQTVFAARTSGLYSSQDGGKSWQYSFESLELEAPLAISFVALAPNFAEMPHVFAAGPGGILRSRDGGQTWYVTMLSSPPPFITGLAVSPNYARDGIVFATTMDDGVFRSSNRGVDWTAWNFGLFDRHILSIAVSPNFAEDKNVFLGTESGIFHSVNGGLGWRETEFKIEHAPVLSLAISPNFVEDGLLFAGTENAGIFCSEDRGDTWTLAAGEDQVDSVNVILIAKDFLDKPDLLITNGDSILLSCDHAQSWQPWRDNLQFDDLVLSIAALNDLSPESILLVGFANGQILQL
jgi:photosystem II stability/assembly factor-like uncharacterized protein